MDFMPAKLLLIFIVIILAVSFLPALVSVINGSVNSSDLNCQTSPNFNSTVQSATIACLAEGIIIPFLLLGVAVFAIAYLMFSQREEVYYQEW